MRLFNGGGILGDKAEWIGPELEEGGGVADMAMALSTASGADEKHLGEAGTKAILKLIKGITPEKIGAVKNTYKLFYGNLLASSGRDFTIDPEEYFIHQTGCEPGVTGFNCCGNRINFLVARVMGVACISGDVDNMHAFVMEIAVGRNVLDTGDIVCSNRHHIYVAGVKTGCYIVLDMVSNTLLRIRGDSKTYIQQIALIRR